MSRKFICNPMNLSYRYVYIDMLKAVFKDNKFVGMQSGRKSLSREAADPSLISFKGKYFMFPSMSKGFWVSDDLASWEYVKLNNVPVYDYAPDVCVVGDWIYFCASKREENCTIYRTKDPMSGNFEEVSSPFPFWDPDMFCDDDGRIYFYWGCSDKDPIHGVELDRKTFLPIGEPKVLIKPDVEGHGFERVGNDHLKQLAPDATELEKRLFPYAGDLPYIEGAWMTKHNGKYYLQYAAPGAEYNVYADGVYVSDSPLGEFHYAANNPYSYKPGGFVPGAGHGSTMEDRYGNFWHVSTMRICFEHMFERRVGLFPAGFDGDGELFCNQRYADWPFAVKEGKIDPWAQPEMYLLSYGKPVTASSAAQGYMPELAVNEDIRSHWKATTNKAGEWLCIDLGAEYEVKAIQVNFADDKLDAEPPVNIKMVRRYREDRYIDERNYYTRWLLEGSVDGKTFHTLCDKRSAETDLPHDLIEVNAKVRYVKLTVYELPYNQIPAVSGLRVFGAGDGNKPKQARIISAVRIENLNAHIVWEGNGCGYTVLWGHSPEKLYHSYTVYGKNEIRIGALNKGQRTWIRVDSFNENGITEGEVTELKD